MWDETGIERYKRTPEQQLEVIKEIDKEDNWIIEGTYRSSAKCLLDLADKIIFLDPPLLKRKFLILLRYIKQKLRIEKCHYKSDLKMLKSMYMWTRDFENNREKFEGMLQEYKDKLIVINNLKKYYSRLNERLSNE